MPIMEISIIPVGTKTASLSKYVAACEAALMAKNRIKAQLTAMGTIVEADSIGALLDIAGEMHKRVLWAGAKRVVTTIKIDDRLDKKATIESKVASVRRKIKHNFQQTVEALHTVVSSCRQRYGDHFVVVDM